MDEICVKIERRGGKVRSTHSLRVSALHTVPHILLSFLANKMTFTALPTMDSEAPLLNDFASYDYGKEASDGKLLKSLTFLAGCSLCLVSALNVLNIFSVLSPSLYLLNFIQGILGFTVIILEGDQYSFLEPYGNMIDTYLKILNLNIGKAIFFYFIALQSFTLTSLSVLYLPEALAWAGIATVLLVGSTKKF
ncbi:hypothetical protein BEWA_002740 [Theileria equi strain WA]|uniref:Uncharacterized protein n=1 Tax=Theileria equi strain WA TaxID=1537102 RepID=L0AZ52_THEEQ|nr:hypothetical protein BEWA_002740 [Theileria equi strain WA]AFZ80867.1 hypothetical protein BEWA_002740 [Theileria equi strain WA]|eukprot:XP_004830533.1 hypothetical protein BEWA_002740 [Theileria equi strain WA]